MGKHSYLYNESETEVDSSLDNLKKKRKPSILKYTFGSEKKTKCKFHSKPEPTSDSDCTFPSESRSTQKIKKLRGILKLPKDSKVRYYSSDDSEVEPARSKHRVFMGRVPRDPYKPVRGGGLALVIKKKSTKVSTPQTAPSSSRKPYKKRSWLSKKFTKNRT